MEVEGQWKWKRDGSGSAIVTVPNGPNEPPYERLGVSQFSRMRFRIRRQGCSAVCAEGLHFSAFHLFIASYLRQKVMKVSAKS